MVQQKKPALPVILLGAGGHAGVVLDALRLNGVPLAGICDPVLDTIIDKKPDLPVISGDSLDATHPPSQFLLANGVGMMPDQKTRRDLFLRMQEMGYSFVTIVHPHTIVADTAQIAEGAQILAGAIIQNAARIDVQTIVNTGAQVDHGCKIGAMVHICPGVVLSGDVTIGDGAFIGAGAIVINGIDIGENAVIGAGAVITRDVPAGARIVTPSSKDLAP